MKRTILLIITMLISVLFYAQTDVDKVNATVTKSDIESQIYFLASDELRGRETGSPEIDIAASYIANTLRKFNVKPIGENDTYYQYVQLEKVSAAKKLSIQLNKFKNMFF